MQRLVTPTAPTQNFSRRGAPTWLALIAMLSAAFAATPPSLVNYQGVLRDASDKPLNGNYDMLFKFFDAATAGTEIMIDQHAAVTSNGITVSGGLFNTQLGSGTISDGSGAGTYTSLDAVFRDYATVYLEVKVGAEVLTPRTRVFAAAYALNTTNATNASNATNLGNQPGSYYLNTSATTQTKSSALTVDATAQAGSIALTGLGTTGGYFSSSNGNKAWVGDSGFGVRALGPSVGGKFENSQVDGGVAFLASGGSGIEARATAAYASPGVFLHFDGSYANVGGGSADAGIEAAGVMNGGSFRNITSNSTYVQLATQSGYGVWTQGADSGGRFISADDSTLALLSYNSTAVAAYTYGAGENPGWFQDFATGTSVSVGKEGYKVRGTGAVSFEQNDPDDPSRVIVYAAPEGDEVAVYTRGSARLVNGVAHVALGPTFRKVTNPDLGLTAHLTPRSEVAFLYATEVTPTELVVRGPAGSEATFDYMVWGLRIGFEDKAIVQPKKHEAMIPSRASDGLIYSAAPDLEQFAARQRYVAERHALQPASRAVDTARSLALEQAIGVYNKERDMARVASPELLADMSRRDKERQAGPAAGAALPASSESDFDRSKLQRTQAPAVGPVGSDPVERRASASLATGEVVAAAFEAIDEPLEAGDLVSISVSGRLVKSATASDPLVYGIVAGSAGQRFATQAPIKLAGASTVCRVDASSAPIAAGDLLVASALPGHAMKAPLEARGGTVVGKALESLSAGTGLIRALVVSR